MPVNRKRRARVVAAMSAASASIAAVGASGGCGGSDPALVFEPEEVERDFVEVVTCVPSRSHAFQVSAPAARRVSDPLHEDRHVSTYADPESADLFERCVLGGEGACSESRFPAGARLVTLHYDTEPCGPAEPVAYTAAERLAGEHPAGEGWRWQWASRDLRLLEDGSPELCTRCHADRCSDPDGFDLLCGQELLPL